MHTYLIDKFHIMCQWFTIAIGDRRQREDLKNPTLWTILKVRQIRNLYKVAKESNLLLDNFICQNFLKDV